MASCTTTQWGNDYSPQIRLTVTESSSDNANVTLSWTLEYVAHGYAAYTNGYGRDYTVYIDGSLVKSGTYNINGVTSTTTIASGSTTVGKTHSSRNVSFSCSFYFDVEWNGTYSGTRNADGSISIGAKTSYTVSFNANNGSGAPGNQTKWYGENLTLSSTKPTRTGYTFNNWNTKSDGSGTGYSSGGTYSSNSGTTLYAQWTENKITVNYYSNTADYCTVSGESVSVSSSTNVKVSSDNFYYDNEYPTGLANIQNANYVFLSKVGYTPSQGEYGGYWGTSQSGGTLIGESESFASGQAIAQAFGKSLASGDQSVDVYVQWRENELTIRYHSNYATSAPENAENAVSADTDVVVKTDHYKYATSIPNGLFNFSAEGDALFMERTRYDATGYWGTSQEIELGRDPVDGIITVNGDIAIQEDHAFANGAELADTLGLLDELEVGDVEVDLWALWVLLCSRVTVYLSDGSAVRGLCHYYDDNGDRHYAILTIYDSNGNARVVI